MAQGDSILTRIQAWWWPVRTVIVREIIGRTSLTRMPHSTSRYKARTIDQTIPHYEFWDRLRRGKAVGYTLGALFAQRIERVFAAWVLGSGVTVKLATQEQTDNVIYTNDQLATFLDGLMDSGQRPESDNERDRDDNQNSLLLTLFKDHLGLGDQYVIVNSDGTLSVPSPDTVDVQRDELDYRQVISYKVTTKLDKFVITDEYFAERRVLTILEGSRVLDKQEFENLIGRIPVVHLAHGMSGNETYGHPIHEELLNLYDQYDDLIYKQLDGAKLFGNPILAITGLEDVNSAYLDNQPIKQDTYTDKDGTEDTRAQMKLDTNSILLLGKGGDSKYVAPPVGFTEDTKTALKSLFLLLLDHTGIPEFIWGNEVASGRSSSETQMSTFEKDIRAWRSDAGGWIVRLCDIWLAMRALVDPQIVLDQLMAQWPAILEEDWTRIRESVQIGIDHSLITDATALRTLDLVENPDAEIEAAREEADEQREQLFGDGFQFGQQLQQAQSFAQNGEDQN